MYLCAMKTNLIRVFALSGLFTLAIAVSATNVSAQEPTKAIAVLHAASGSNVAGTVTFTKTSDGVDIVADVSGLTPGKHGFHIHEFGDCSAPDATSAGGHFNPMHKAHGPPDAAEHHAGDLGNLEADA